MRRATSPRIARFKRDLSDLQTDMDVAVERLVVKRIKGAYPDERVISEEMPQAAQQKFHDPAWIIDPIDGTTNFFHRLPLFACNIAYWDGQDVTVAVTIDVARNRLYWAERGRGSWMGRRRLHVSSAEDLSDAVVTTGFPEGRQEAAEANFEVLRRLLFAVRAVRRVGCAGLELAWVAAGLTDGYWEVNNAAWDWAPGALLVREAGGVVTDHTGQPWRPGTTELLTANPTVHRKLIGLMPSATSPSRP